MEILSNLREFITMMFKTEINSDRNMVLNALQDYPVFNFSKEFTCISDLGEKNRKHQCTVQQTVDIHL